VDITVGSGESLPLIASLHSNLVLMTSLSGSTDNPKLKFWMLDKWPQYSSGKINDETSYNKIKTEKC
jgi:hypothetical protein